MRIEDLDRLIVGDRVRIEARFVYEDVDLPPLTVYYEAGPPLADALEAIPEAFALPAFPIALWEGEQRLKLEGALDTTLSAGLGQVASLLADWYGRCSSPPVIEPAQGHRVLRPRPEHRTVALFGGGVDTMAMMSENRRLLPLDHANSIRSVVYAFGFSVFDFPDGSANPRMLDRYQAQASRFEALGERIGFELSRLESNVLSLHPSVEPFYEAAGAGALLAPLVASPGFVSDAWIASDGEGGSVKTPHGSHPMLDVLYSTGAVRIHHVQPQVTRNEKLGMIASWEPAYDTLVVCHGELEPPEDTPNCGKCEKCVRTMVGLVSWDALPRFTTFPFDDVTPAMIDAIWIRQAYTFITMPDVLAGLLRVGRTDLVQALEARVDQFSEGRWARRRRGWKHSIVKRLPRLGRSGA
jgi:hypothetical protein